MSLELNKKIDELSGNFAKFQAANDELQDHIKKFGHADVLLEEKVDKINAEITVNHDAIKKIHAETTDRMDELEARLNRGGLGGGAANDEKAMEQAQKFYALINGQAADGRDVDADVEEFSKYQNAFKRYLRKGDKVSDINAALSVGSDPEGGYWVEPTIAQRIVERIYDTSPMRSIANVETIGTDSYKGPYESADATSGGWVGEKAARSDSDEPDVGMYEIQVHEQYAQPKTTQKLLDDANRDVEAWLVRRTSRKMSRTENTGFVTGNGVDQPRGFLDYGAASVTTNDSTRNWGLLQHVVSGAAGAFPKVSGSLSDDAGALIDLVTKLHPDYRDGAKWVMNRTTEATVRKLRDADGKYLVGTGDLKEGLNFNLHGFDIVNLEDMPDIAADSYSIGFGNFDEGYTIVQRQGIRVLRDPFTDKPFVKFYMTMRVGGDVVNFDAIKLLKFAA